MDGPLEEWSEWMRAAGASDKTIETRLKGISALCSNAGIDDPVSLTTRQIVRWLAGCNSAWTRSTYATSVRLWHKWLVDQELRADDPTERVPRPPQPRGVPRPAATSVLGAVLPTAPRRARAYILLCAFEGLRVSEVARVRGEDFDGEGWLYVNGKGSVSAALPVHQLVEQLRVGFPVEGWWFPSNGGHVTPEAVSATISRTFQRAGYRVRAHELRHWFGTHALRNSRDLRVVQDLMRHASPSSTAIYTQVASRRKQEAVWGLKYR